MSTNKTSAFTAQVLFIMGSLETQANHLILCATHDESNCIYILDCLCLLACSNSIHNMNIK